jgi:hypothetical protein
MGPPEKKNGYKVTWKALIAASKPGERPTTVYQAHPVNELAGRIHGEVELVNPPLEILWDSVH